MGALVSAFERQVRERPSQEALWSRSEGLRLSFSELAERAATWHGALEQDRRPLALALGNRSAFFEIFLAARYLGIPVVLMEAAGSAADRLELCRQLGISRLIHAPSDAEEAVSSVGGSSVGGASVGGPPVDVQSIVLGADIVEARLSMQHQVQLPSSTGIVKLTSGSTGRPVAACFTEEGLHLGARQIGEGMDIHATDRVVLAIPASHSYGFDNGFLSTMVLGTTLILQSSIFPRDLLRAVVETEGTFLPLVPPLVRSLASSQWPSVPSLRKVICAGGMLAPEFARDFELASGLAVHNFYGSTETGGITFERDPRDPASHGTVGKLLPGVTLELDDGGAVRVLSGANLIGRAVLPTPPGDGLSADRDCCSETATDALPPLPVLTGDVGQLTADGRLRLVGRTADLLNIGGRRVAAVAVEEALRRLKGVSDAAVVGVPDAMRGDRTVAFLVADTWPIEMKCLPNKLRPREARRVETLPHNARGKLDRAELKRLAATPPHPKSHSGTK